MARPKRKGKPEGPRRRARTIFTPGGEYVNERSAKEWARRIYRAKGYRISRIYAKRDKLELVVVFVDQGPKGLPSVRLHWPTIKEAQ